MYYVMLEPCYCVLRSSVADDFLNESKCSDTYLRTLLIHGAGTVALLTKLGSWITELKKRRPDSVATYEDVFI